MARLPSGWKASNFRIDGSTVYFDLALSLDAWLLLLIEQILQIGWMLTDGNATAGD